MNEEGRGESRARRSTMERQLFSSARENKREEIEDQDDARALIKQTVKEKKEGDGGRVSTTPTTTTTEGEMMDLHRLGHWTTAIAVSLASLVALALLTPLLIVALLLALARFGLASLAYDDARIDDELKLYEAKFLESAVRSREVEHIERTLDVAERSTTTRVHVHALRLRPDGSGERPTAMLVHGVGASSMSFVYMMEHLSMTYDVYAIDLPGFGRSHIETGGGFARLAATYSGGDSTDFHCRVIEEFMKALGIGQTYLCGHSYGGYVCSRFCVLSPSRVSGLILVNPAGLLPTLGGLGAYWACVFKFAVVNVGKRFGSLGYAAITHFWRDSHEGLYWYYLLSHPRGIGHHFVREKITLSWTSAYWNKPSFAHFDEDIRCPVCFIYGEDDSIMPPHQGMMMKSVYGHELRTIPNEGHNPMSTRESGLVVAMEMMSFLKELQFQLRDEETTFAVKTRELISPPSTYRSSFYIPKTVSVIDKLYQDIAKAHGVQVNIDVNAVEKRRV